MDAGHESDHYRSTAAFSGALQAKPAILAGNLSSVGSDTLGNLMALWGESFNRQYPGVNVQVQAAGPLPRPPLWLRAPRSWAP